MNRQPPNAPKKPNKRKSVGASDVDGDMSMDAGDRNGTPEGSAVKRNKEEQIPFVFGGVELNKRKDEFLRNLQSSYIPPPSTPPLHDANPDEEIKEPEQDPSFDSLLNTFSKMEFPDSEREGCPICNTNVAVLEFASHVYKCADKLDAEDRVAQEKRSENFALGLIEGHDVTQNWVTPSGTPSNSQNRAEYGIFRADFETECPVCQKKLVLGTAINQHINECLDKSMTDESQNTSGPQHQSSSSSFVSSNGFGRFRENHNEMFDENDDEKDIVEQMDESAQTPLLSSRQQLAACAKMLVKEEKGSDKYNDLLESFKGLGLTKENLQNSLREKS